MRLSNVKALLLSALVVLLAFANYWVVRQNSSLQRSVQRLTQPLPGAKLPPLHAYNAAGSRTTIEFRSGGPRTLFFIFLPVCEACDINWPAWRVLADAVKPDPNIRLFYVDLATYANFKYFDKYRIPG